MDVIKMHWWSKNLSEAIKMKVCYYYFALGLGRASEVIWRALWGIISPLNFSLTKDLSEEEHVIQRACSTQIPPLTQSADMTVPFHVGFFQESVRVRSILADTSRSTSQLQVHWEPLVAYWALCIHAHIQHTYSESDSIPDCVMKCSWKEKK